MAVLRSDMPMSLGDHLHELRRRLIPPLLIFAVGFVVGFSQEDLLNRLFVQPLIHACDVAEQMRHGSVADAGINLVRDNPKSLLKTFDLSESVWVTMSLAMWFGALFAIPVFLQQMWSFIAVGLKSRERQLAFILVPFAVISFYLGAAFGYYIGMPYFFGWFIEWTSRSPIASLDLRLASYRDDFFCYTIVFGLLFDVPWAVVSLVRVGFTTVAKLASWRKYVLFAVAVVSGLVTPPDPISMLVFMAPTYLLFEVGLLLAWLIGGPKPPAVVESRDG